MAQNGPKTYKIGMVETVTLIVRERDETIRFPSELYTMTGGFSSTAKAVGMEKEHVLTFLIETFNGFLVLV